MIPAANTDGRINIVASNILGSGATELTLSLLPALEAVGGAQIGLVWIPARGRLATIPRSDRPNYRRYRRILPNAVSRFIECLALAPFVYGRRELLVLGDLPLRTTGRQVVLVHTSFLVKGSNALSQSARLKSGILRAVFRWNMMRAHRIVVQTPIMAEGIARTYPLVSGRIRILPQPPPTWLNGLKLPRRDRAPGTPLTLFYPAAAYPHKNHRLLLALSAIEDVSSMLAKMVVTIDPDPVAPTWMVMTGHLPPDEMRVRYAEADALVFPSLEESFGLPLVEAMYLGLPILCSDKPFARNLCGGDAIYFDPRSAASLRDAMRELQTRLDAGWRPDWSGQLRNFPPDWETVALQLIALFYEEDV